jgi:hypothetical protein
MRQERSIGDAAAEKVLAVVDWDLGPDATAEVLADRARQHASHLGVLVPARLHGLGWAGDPRSSRPCAERQLADLRRRLRDAGVHVDAGWVGDPETVPAIADALEAWHADEVMLLRAGREHPRLQPLALSRRVRRLSGLPVSRISAPRRRR